MNNVNEQNVSMSEEYELADRIKNSRNKEGCRSIGV